MRWAPMCSSWCNMVTSSLSRSGWDPVASSSWRKAPHLSRNRSLDLPQYLQHLFFLFCCSLHSKSFFVMSCLAGKHSAFRVAPVSAASPLLGRIYGKNISCSFASKTGLFEGRVQTYVSHSGLRWSLNEIYQ